MRKGFLVALILVVFASLFGLYFSGRMDPTLSKIGLNWTDCVMNGFGATYCGEDAKVYAQNLAEAQAQSEAAAAEAEAAMAEAQAQAEAAQAQMEKEQARLEAEMAQDEAEMAQEQARLEAEMEAAMAEAEAYYP